VKTKRIRIAWFAAVLAVATLAAAPAPTTADVPSVSINVTITAVNNPYGWGWNMPIYGGTFEATGDVEDEGAATGGLAITTYWPPTSYICLGLECDQGILIVWIHVQSDTWFVYGGTGAYETATGGGTYTCTTSGLWWSPTYHYALSGSVSVP
jgi:hypothetical protein